MIQPFHSPESAVSELIGAILLISLSVIAVSLIGVQLMSQPQPEKIPALDAVISNNSRTVYVFHAGGDEIHNNEIKIYVDGIDRTTEFTRSGSSWVTWSIGQTINCTLPVSSSPPRLVTILYASPTGGGTVVIAQSSFVP